MALNILEYVYNHGNLLKDVKTLPQKRSPQKTETQILQKYQKVREHYPHNMAEISELQAEISVLVEVKQHLLLEHPQNSRKNQRSNESKVPLPRREGAGMRWLRRVSLKGAMREILIRVLPRHFPAAESNAY